MKLASKEKIQRYRASGQWGDDTIFDLFAQAMAQAPPDEVLLDAVNRTDLDGNPPLVLTAAAALDMVQAYAAQLHASGLTRGDIVVAQAPNIVELVALYLACARLGLIISPLPMQYGKHELRHVIDALQPVAFVGGRLLKSGDPLALAATMLAPSTLMFTLNGSDTEAARRLLPAVTAEALAAIADLAGPDADDCFTICWTSGTTGQPKGVPRSHNHWVAQGPAMYHGLGMTRGDRLLSPFPFTNMAAIGGVLMGWLLDRGTLILHHPFDLAVLLKQVKEQHPNVLLLPPAVLNMLLKDPALAQSVDFSGVLSIGSGSAPLAAWMVAQWQDRGVPVVNVFGSNEGAAFITGVDDVPDPQLRASCFPRFGQNTGQWSNPVSENIESRLLGPEGEIVDHPGQPGELYIRGPNVFEGYWGMSAQQHRDQALFDADGYFRTGDLFEIVPEDPRLMRFVARCKDIIVRGGVNISMEELDQLLADHPALVEVATFILPDEVMGERVGVAVVPAAAGAPTLEDLARHLEEKGVAVFKRPEKMLLIEALPRNPMNKVLRHQLTERAIRAEATGGD